MKLKKSLSFLLSLSVFVAASVSTVSVVNAVEVQQESSLVDLAAEVTGNSYGLRSEIQEGTILHCFNWQYNDIKGSLQDIANAGFTSIQTSPAQPCGSSSRWYMLYQPLGFYIGSNKLGTKADLEALCSAADSYGIKVVVDVVANHLAGDHSNIDSDLKSSKYWHSDTGSIDYTNRWQIHQRPIGMPDINSENSYVQQKVRSYVDELKSVGVDGIRWDAAKHIALPSEGCNFWPSVIEGSGLWNYGEILDEPVSSDGNRGIDNFDTANSLMKEYTKYMSVTDSIYGTNMRTSFRDGNISSSIGNWSERGVSKSKLVYWAESHDTYSNNGSGNDASQNISQNKIDRAYAIVASQNKATALYFSRPSSKDKESIKSGVKGSTHFTSKEVAAVNHFHNAMVGQKEYYVHESGVAAVCRTGGAVVVKGSGSGSVKIKNGGGTTTPGTYKDEITGNIWTVTSSSISGEIGDTGIAVIYNSNIDTDTSTDTSSDTSTDTSTDVPIGDVALFFDNSSYNWNTVYAYIYDDTQTPTAKNEVWPGVRMTKDSGTGYYVINVPDNLQNGKVIFAEKESSPNRYPASQEPGLLIEGKSKIFGANNSWTDYNPFGSDTDTSTDISSDTNTDTGTDTDTSSDINTDTSTDTSSDTNTDTSTDTDIVDKVTVLLGDSNLDGKVSLRDASVAFRGAVQAIDLDEKAFLSADVTMDNELTTADVLAIMQYDVKIRVIYDIGSIVEREIKI